MKTKKSHQNNTQRQSNLTGTGLPDRLASITRTRNNFVPRILRQNFGAIPELIQAHESLTPFFFHCVGNFFCSL